MTRLRIPISLLLAVVLLLSCFPGVSAREDDGSGSMLNVADHVIFGSYEGTELKWQVMHTEGELALLLCYTPFAYGEYDASPHIYTYTGPLYQYNYGSVAWRTSDVRQFLNSSQRRMNFRDEKFDYTGLSYGIGGSYDTDNSDPRYADHSGLLYEDNFLQEERALIESVTHRSLTSVTDPQAQGNRNMADSRTYHDYISADRASELYNGDYLYSEQTDEIFLLSVEEYSSYASFNNEELRGKQAPFPSNDWWLRDVCNSYINMFAQYHHYGYKATTAQTGRDANVPDMCYIRPACWINMSYIEAMSGEGTEASPYRFHIDPEVVNRENYITRDIYDEHPDTLTLTVYRNAKPSHEGSRNLLASNVQIIAGDRSYTTDENGNVTIPYPAGSVTFRLAGYVERSLTGPKLEENPRVILQQESEYPVVSALWSGSADILHDTLHVDLMNAPTVLLRPEVAGGVESLSQLYLRQDAATVNLISGSATVRWADHFDVSEPIYLIAVNNNGLKSTYELKLHVDAFVLTELSNFKFDLKEMNFTIGTEDPKNVLNGLEFETGLYSPIECIVSVENDRFYVAVGFTPGFESDSLSGGLKGKDLCCSAKGLIESLEGISDYGKQYQKIQDFMKKHDKNIVKGKGQWGFEADFTFLGFAEGYINKKGEMIFLDSGLVLGAKAKGEFTKPFVVGPVPAFFSIALTSEIQSRMNLFVDPNADAFIPNSTITWSTTLTGELGVGAKDVISLSGGVDGTLTSTWDLDYEQEDYYKLRGSANVFGKIAVAKMELKVPFDPFYDKVLYEYPEIISPNAVVTMADLYETDGYSFTGTAGVNSITDISGSMERVNGAEPAVYGDTTVLAVNTYQYAEPKVVQQSDGSYAAFFVAKGAGDSMNDLQIYVMVLRDGVWSEPKLVLDDGTADNAPDVLAADGETWVVWQNISEPVSDQIGLEELAEKTVIQAACLDLDGNLSQNWQLTEPGLLCMDPQLAHSGSSVYAVWQTNGDHDWFGAEHNSIWSAQCTDGIWAENSERYSDRGMIVDMDVLWQNDRLEIAWSEDTDGNTATVDDLEVYLLGSRKSRNNLVDSGVNLSHSFLYWYRDGLIVTEDNAEDPCAVLPTDQYQIIAVDNDTRIMVYKVSTGLSSQLMAIWRVAGSGWLEAVPISSADMNVGDYSIDYDGETLTVLYTATELTEDGTQLGQTHLLVKQITPEPDVQLMNITSDGSTYLADRDMTLELELFNRGGDTSGVCTIQVLDGENILAEDTLLTPIYPGKSCTTTISFHVDTVEQGKEVTVRVLCEDDANELDNEMTHTLSWADLALEQLSWGQTEDGRTVLTGTVVNRGYTDFGDVTVSLRRDGPDGQIVAQQTVSAPNLLSAAAVTFYVDTADELWYLVLELADDNPGNNSAFTPVYADVTEVNLPFTDVPEDSFYYDPVVWALEKGVTTGATDTTFNPGGQCLRAHVVTFLWRAAGCPEPAGNTNPFVDVKQSDFYYKAVLWAVENGITNGADATHFNPMGICNRAQVVTFLYRAMGKPAYTTQKNPFADVVVTDFYGPAVLWAVENGITNGMGDGTFGINNPCNRAQVVTFLYRTYN